MNPLTRWLKFNLVGAVGMVVQLATLALLIRILPRHYLLATAAAIELTLFHNFLWHTLYTWNDCRDTNAWPKQLLRFHLANGCISLAGNLVLMWLFVHDLHVPVMPSNALAILCCSVANFLLSHRWIFASSLKARTTGAAVLLLLSLSLAHPCSAQQEASSTQRLPETHQPDPMPKPPSRNLVGEYPNYYIGAFCASGVSSSSTSSKPTFGCGADSDFVPLPVFIELGVMGPQAIDSNVSGYVSLDTSIPLAPAKTSYFPMAMIGYSYLFQSGHSLDYALALGLPRTAHPKSRYENIRLELRDYWIPADPSKHNIMFRIGWISEIWD